MYRVSEKLRLAATNHGTVLLDIKGDQMFNLNPVGSRILQFLQDGRDKTFIVNSIALEFTVGQKIAAADLDEFLALLEQHALISPAECLRVPEKPREPTS